MSRFIYDHTGNVVKEVIHENDRTTFAEHENVEPLLRKCHTMREHVSLNRKSAYRPIAEVPMSVVADAIKQGWFSDKSRWKKWYNDSHNALLRLSTGRF